MTPAYCFAHAMREYVFSNVLDLLLNKVNPKLSDNDKMNTALAVKYANEITKNIIVTGVTNVKCKIDKSVAPRLVLNPSPYLAIDNDIVELCDKVTDRAVSLMLSTMHNPFINEVYSYMGAMNATHSFAGNFPNFGVMPTLSPAFAASMAGVPSGNMMRPAVHPPMPPLDAYPQSMPGVIPVDMSPHIPTQALHTQSKP